MVSEPSEAQVGVGLDSRGLTAAGSCMGSPRDTAATTMQAAPSPGTSATIPAQRRAVSHRAVFRSEVRGSSTEGGQWT